MDETFPERAKEARECFIVGGSNYGQGSSREHAALVPLYLGVRAVIAKSFARIHMANLINAGILPLTFKNPEDYDKLAQSDLLMLTNVYKGLENGTFFMCDDKGNSYELVGEFTERQREILRLGGLLSYTKEKQK